MHHQRAPSLHGYLDDLLAAVRAFQQEHRGPLKLQVQATDLDEDTLALLR